MDIWRVDPGIDEPADSLWTTREAAQQRATQIRAKDSWRTVYLLRQTTDEPAAEERLEAIYHSSGDIQAWNDDGTPL